MIKQKKNRIITVSAIYQNRIDPDKRTAPYIRLKGSWLKAAGFKENDVIEIEVMDNCLVIRNTGKHWYETVTKTKTLQ